MSAPALSDALMDQAIAAAKAHSTHVAAARSLGISLGAFDNRLRRAQARPGAAKDTSDPIKLRAAADENARLRMVLRDAERRTARPRTTANTCLA
jgi:hypothetical protein